MNTDEGSIIDRHVNKSQRKRRQKGVGYGDKRSEMSSNRREVFLPSAGTVGRA